MNPFVVLVFVVGITGSLLAQKDRYKFAQAYAGLQGGWLTTVGNGGSANTAPDFAETRFVIGGTHFWNKADFYVSFPLFSRGLSGNSAQWYYSDGVVTGGRLLPLGLKHKYPTPYAGLQWVVPGTAMGEGPLVMRSRFGVEAGVIMVPGRSWTLEAGVKYVLNQHYPYYLTRERMEMIHSPNLGVQVALKKYFDFTATLGSEEAQRFTQVLHRRMAEQGGLNAFSFAAGFSAVIPLSSVPFAEQFPWVDDRPLVALYPDVGIGYYFHRPDMELRFAFRPLTLVQNSHDLDLACRQRHFAGEAFKFLFDYKGFVPFAGLSAGAGSYRFLATDSGSVIARQSGVVFSYALVFGWDIRPTDVEWFILRTNLRYMPPVGLRAEGLRITAHQLEFNFIQFVFYPERLVRLRQIRKEKA